MLIEYIRDNSLAGLLLPVAHVAAQPQEIHPRRELEAIYGEVSIRAEARERMDITVMRQIGTVRLLDPKRHGFTDQCLEFDFLAVLRYSIDSEFIIAAQT